jgi:hypothetical protein
VAPSLEQMMQSKEKALNSDGPSPPKEELPFRVELWHDGGGDAIERVLARAASAQLARAIFKAAQGDHPQRRITLRRGNRIIADSAK